MAIMGETGSRQNHACSIFSPPWTSPPAARSCWTEPGTWPPAEGSRQPPPSGGTTWAFVFQEFQPAGHLYAARTTSFLAAGAGGQCATPEMEKPPPGPPAGTAGHIRPCWTNIPTRYPAGRSSAPPPPGRIITEPQAAPGRRTHRRTWIPRPPDELLARILKAQHRRAGPS